MEYTVFGQRIVMHKATAVATPGILFGHFLNHYREEVPVVLKLAQTAKGSVCRDLTRESAILRKLNDDALPSVVRMFEFNTNHSPAYLVLEAFGSSMETFLKSNNLPMRKVIALQLSEAVRSIHLVGLMHGDLKPSNVLVRLDSGGGVELKLTDFDSARFIGGGNESLYPHVGPQLKYTMAWVGGPEVLFGSGGVLQASLSIDLFALGLVLTVLLRPQCAPSSTALPPDEAKLRDLLSDEAALCAQLQVQGLRHASAVTRLCRLKPECRGTASDVVTELHQAGATVLHRENQQLKGDNVFLKEQVVQKVSEMHVDVKATHNEVIALRNDIVTLHEDVLVKLNAATMSVVTELTGTMLGYSKEAQTFADSQFAELRAGLGEEVAGVRALLGSIQTGNVLGVADLQNLSQDLLSSFMQCAGQMSAATEDSIRTACGEMQLSLQAAVSSEQQASHAEIVAMLTSYEEQLSSLQQSSQELLASVQVVRDHQQEVVETTRDLLLDGNAGLLQAVADFSDDLSSLSTLSSSDFVAEMEKLTQRDERMQGFVSNLAGILEDMQDSHEASADFQTQSLLMMTQMGGQLRHVAREVEVVQSKLDALPGKVSADTGVLMAAHSSTLLEHMQAVHDKVSSSLQGFEKVRQSEQQSVIKTVEGELKTWLSATLTEAGVQHSEAVMEAIHTQHKMTAQAIAELQHLHAKSQDVNRQAQKESKEEVFNMLTDMKSTLSEVLTAVSACEQTCVALSDGVSRLTSEGSREASQTQALLSALQQATLDTKKALETQTRTSQSQSGDKSAAQSDAVLAILEEMSAKFNEQLRQQEVSTELQASLNSALEEMRQQQAKSDAGSEVGLAATQQKLDVVLSALEESGKQLGRLQAMSAAQHELLAAVEKRGNLLPRQFIIVPDMQPLKATPGSILKSIKRKVCRVFWKKVRLFFVCDISDKCALTGGPDERGYEIEIPSTTLKALLPVLVGSVAVLKVVLQLHGVPAGLVPSLPDLPGDCIVQALMDGLPSGDEAVDQMASHLTTHGEGLQAAEEPKSQLPPLSGWEPRYTGLSKVSVRAAGSSGTASQPAGAGAATGGSRWVLPEHVDLYAQHGDGARGILQQQQQKA
jgi:serine/threonine protein kinase